MTFTILNLGIFLIWVTTALLMDCARWKFNHNIAYCTAYRCRIVLLWIITKLMHYALYCLSPANWQSKWTAWNTQCSMEETTNNVWNGFHSSGVIRQVIVLCTHQVGIWLADYRSTMVNLLVTIASRSDDAGLQMVTPNTTQQATRLKSLPSPPNVQWVGWSIQQTHHYRQVPWWQDALTQETICMWHCSHCRIRKPSPWGTTMLVWDVDMPQNTRIHTRLSWWTWWSSFKWYANNQVAQSSLAHSQVSSEQYHHWENCLVKTLSNGAYIFSDVQTCFQTCPGGDEIFLWALNILLRGHYCTCVMESKYSAAIRLLCFNFPSIYIIYTG